MSYLNRVPTYAYELPCGHDFHSRTESHPDDVDGLHWLYCKRCRAYYGLLPRDLVGGRPLYASGSKRIGDYQLSVQQDSAIVRDRIAAFYRNVWNTVTVLDVATALDVSPEQVKYVAIDLGVYDSAARDLGDAYR